MLTDDIMTKKRTFSPEISPHTQDLPFKEAAMLAVQPDDPLANAKDRPDSYYVIRPVLAHTLHDTHVECAYLKHEQSDTYVSC